MMCILQLAPTTPTLLRNANIYTEKSISHEFPLYYYKTPKNVTHFHIFYLWNPVCVTYVCVLFGPNLGVRLHLRLIQFFDDNNNNSYEHAWLYVCVWVCIMNIEKNKIKSVFFMNQQAGAS